MENLLFLGVPILKHIRVIVNYWKKRGRALLKVKDLAKQDQAILFNIFVLPDAAS